MGWYKSQMAKLGAAFFKTGTINASLKPTAKQQTILITQQ